MSPTQTLPLPSGSFVVRLTKRLIIPATVLVVLLTLIFVQEPAQEYGYRTVSAFQLLRAPSGLSFKLQWKLGSPSTTGNDDFLNWGFQEDEENQDQDDGWGFLRQLTSSVLSSSDPTTPSQHQVISSHHRAFPGQLEPNSRSAHRYKSNGLLEVNPDGTHPILELIRRSEEQWQDKLKRSSRTLREAVIEYKRRYRRMPPKGFDKWWNYIVSHDVQLPDEYDRINYDIAPFWGIKPKALQELQHRWQRHPDTFTLRVNNGFAYLYNQALSPKMLESGLLRAGAQLEIIKMVEQMLPDFRATFFAHDGPSQFIDWEMRAELLEQASNKEYRDFDHEFDRRHLGWASACPPRSPLRAQDPLRQINLTAIWERPKSFVFDHKLAMDPCIHPSHAHLVGMLEGQGIGPLASESLYPSFTICASPLHADILTVANENWTEDVGEDPDWEDKTEERLVWRGSTTGVLFDAKNRWELSQRVRLVQLTNQRNGTVDVISSPSTESQLPGPSQPMNLAWANNIFMDVAFAGSPIQCEGPGMCEGLEEVLDFKPGQSKKEANEYKYIMDIDGNGWSSRFKRLITNKSLILKATIFPEWYTDRIQPWVHYVPVKNDLTDLYDIMTFFRGNFNGQGSHDYLAKAIATEGRRWSQTFWRKQDMAAYMLRLFLEYARVMNSDRESMTFTWADLAAVEETAPRRAFVKGR